MEDALEERGSFASEVSNPSSAPKMYRDSLALPAERRASDLSWGESFPFASKWYVSDRSELMARSECEHPHLQAASKTRHCSAPAWQFASHLAQRLASSYAESFGRAQTSQ